MKIGEALSEKKRLQVRLAKCYELLKRSYYYKGKKPDFDYKKLRSEADKLEKEILKLKIKIQWTNLTKKVKIPGNDEITLAELIIRIGDIRSKISALGSLYGEEDRYSFRSMEEIETKTQVKPEAIELEVKNLNKLKTELDGILQHTNWTVDLSMSPVS